MSFPFPPPTRPPSSSPPFPNPWDLPEPPWKAASGRRPERLWVHVALFLLTFVTTTVVGAGHYAAFLSEFGARPVSFSATLLLQGCWYSVPVLAILGAHELGHYLACRYYGVEASLPYFLPAPVILTGTLGAFIRIRQPIPSKSVLFDIGVAGPIAGFVVAVPALAIGLALSTVAALPSDFVGLSLGEPPLFRALAWLIWGTVPDGHSINLHPTAFAAWFGLLATALNLFPIGQLDGGHITYAVLGPRSTLVSVGAAVGTILLAFWSTSWLVWAVLMVVMLALFGPRHPRTIDEHVPLDPSRQRVALFAAGMFALCFTPAPVEPLELLRRV